jgi:hypothetical protein
LNQQQESTDVYANRQIMPKISAEGVSGMISEHPKTDSSRQSLNNGLKYIGFFNFVASQHTSSPSKQK